MNTELCLEIKNRIETADSIVIGAGSGLSTAAGIDYGSHNFKEKYPELVKYYGFTDMYTSSFYEFKSEEEKWSYWAKHINDLCLDRKATKTYKDLYNLVKDKNYFVITTNVDRQFFKAGFDQDRVFDVQGSLAKIQCSKACHNKLYDDTKLVKEMLEKNKNIKIPTSLVPHCPICNGKMEVNLRKDQYFVQDEHWYKLNKNYEEFLNENKNKKIVFLELGVGFNTPGIIRYPFEEFTYNMKKAYLIRINNQYAEIPEEIENKGVGIKGDISKILGGIINGI